MYDTLGTLLPPVPQAEAATNNTPPLSVCTHLTPAPPRDVIARLVVVAEVEVERVVVRLVIVEEEELERIPPGIVMRPALEIVNRGVSVVRASFRAPITNEP